MIDANYYICVKGTGIGFIDISKNDIDCNISYFSDINDEIVNCLMSNLFPVLKKEYGFDRNTIEVLSSKLQVGGTFIIDLLDKNILDVPESRMLGKSIIRTSGGDLSSNTQLDSFYKDYEKKINAL